ncbi:MAG: ribosomal protein S18-alanine N-acetyltransferase [Firmicutes bacterium]|nr:ribosomal protein S18-alanine N-acetyltransferase [Bacillota bacterium]
MITMKPVIRQMTMADINQVYDIERRSQSAPWSKMTFQRELLGNHHNMCLVAELGERIVGFICMYYVLDEAHITNIAVDLPFQNKGIGTRLMLAAIEVMMDRGIKHITLEVRKSNTKAQHLYMKFGFRMKGIRKGYYTDNYEDAFIFWTGDITSDYYKKLFSEISKELERKYA